MVQKDDYDLQAVIDDGNIGSKPSDNYVKNLDALENIMRECIFVSRTYKYIKSPSGKHFYASVLFAVLISRGVSLLMLSPHTTWSDKKIEHWDYASLAGIVRTMIELRVAFYYICTENCSTDEWNARWNLFNLHDCVSRIRLFEALGNVDQIEAFKVHADEIRQRLKSNLYFQAIDIKQHKKLLHGQTAYFSSLEFIADRAGLSVKDFRWLYLLFSSHVHGLPMSFYRIGGDNPTRGVGLPSEVEESYSSLCLSLAVNLMVHTRDEIHELFDGLGHKIEDPPPDESVEMPSTHAFAVGESTSIEVTSDMRFVFTRAGEDTVNTAYFYQPSDVCVLERSNSDSQGNTVISCDPFFWQFLLNGQPTTEGALALALKASHAFRVDHVKKIILIKTI